MKKGMVLSSSAATMGSIVPVFDSYGSAIKGKGYQHLKGEVVLDVPLKKKYVQYVIMKKSIYL